MALSPGAFWTVFLKILARGRGDFGYVRRRYERRCYGQWLHAGWRRGWAKGAGRLLGAGRGVRAIQSDPKVNFRPIL